MDLAGILATAASHLAEFAAQLLLQPQPLKLLALLLVSFLLYFGLQREKARSPETQTINGSKRNTQNQDASSEISAFWGVPESPCLEGVMTPPLGPVFSNPKTPALFENEFCKGACLTLHRTT